MLIESPRHRAMDLELWDSLELCDRIRASSYGYRFRYAASLKALLEFIPGPPVYAGVSWGKDSVVVAYLMRCVMPSAPLVHLRPTNHNPDCDAVRDDYLSRFPGQPYHEIPVDYGDLHRQGLPHQLLDKATDSRWYAAIRECEKRFGSRHILGIRADESTGRRMRMLRWGESSPNACAPIVRWSTEDVFACLVSHDLPVHPAYACLGGGRWQRERLRVAELGDTHGAGGGRAEWEREYYGAELRRIEAGVSP